MTLFKLNIDIDANVFYQASTRRAILPLTNLTSGEYRISKISLDLICMFNISKLFSLHDDTILGYVFDSDYRIENKGAYILCNFKNKLATECEVILRNKNLIIFHYPGCGSLCISPKVNDNILQMLMNQ